MDDGTLTVARNSPPRAFREIRKALSTGPTILFTGAGPSCALNGPGWGKLQDRLVDVLVPDEYKSRCAAPSFDWWKLTQFLCDTLGKRAEVEQFIESELEAVNPAPWFLDLMGAPWSYIYTTNYDDVCARLNHLTGAGGMHFEEYMGGRLPRKHRQGSIIKVMGDCRRRAPDAGAMILSEADRSVRSTAKAYLAAMRHLREELANGSNLVILGQSLSDGVLAAILADLNSMPDAKIAGRIFFVNPSKPDWEIQALLDQMGCTFIHAMAEELANQVADVVGPLPETRSRTVRVQGQRISIGEPVLQYFDRTAEIYDSERNDPDVRTPRDFIARSIFSRRAFREGWDFPRMLVRQDPAGAGNEGTATELTRTLRASANRSALIEGAPGCAKTMTALRLGNEWIDQGGIVVFANLLVHRAGGAALADAVEALQQEIAAMSDIGPELLEPGILVIMDNAGRHHRTLHRFWSRVEERGLENFSLVVTGQPSNVASLRDRFDSVWRLPDRLTEVEAERIEAYATKLPSPPSTPEIRGLVRQRDIISYWEILYRLVEPSREGLEKSVARVVSELPTWQKELAIHSAYFKALGVALPLSVYSRMDNTISRPTIREEISTQLLGEVVAIDSSRGIDCLDFHNETSAAAVVQQFLSTRPGFHMVARAIDVIQTLNEEELMISEVHRSIAVRDEELSPLGKQILPLAEREQLLARLSDQFPTAETVLQHARMLRIRTFYDEADRRLDQALVYATTAHEERRIRHQMGVVALRWGKRLAQAGEDEEARSKWEIARRYLEDERQKYDDVTRSLHADFLEFTANLTEDEAEKESILWEAFHQARLARALSTKAKSREILDHMIRRLGHRLAADEVSEETAIRLARDFRSSAAFHAIVEGRIMPFKWQDSTNEQRAKALEVVRKLLTIIPEDAHGLENLARLLLLEDPADEEIPSVLESLDAAGGKIAFHLLAAFRSACVGAEGTVRQNLSDLQRADPDFEIPAERRLEFTLRDRSGPQRFEVRAGSPNWVNWGSRVAAPDFGPGDAVHLVMGLSGVRAVPTSTEQADA